MLRKNKRAKYKFKGLTRFSPNLNFKQKTAQIPI